MRNVKPPGVIVTMMDSARYGTWSGVHGRLLMTDTERLARLVGELVDGWTERVEYNIVINMRVEARATSVYQRPLIDQLMSEASGYAPVSMGSRWGKPDSRPPATLDLMGLVESIDQYLAHQEAEGRGRLEKLRNLVSKSSVWGDEWTRETCHELRRFIRTARIMLQYDVPQRKLTETVCHICGGSLAVAVDADSDVRCVGTTQQTSCGQIYRKTQWIDLLPEDA
jgi:hypothetical protein